MNKATKVIFDSCTVTVVISRWQLMTSIVLFKPERTILGLWQLRLLHSMHTAELIHSYNSECSCCFFLCPIMSWNISTCCKFDQKAVTMVDVTRFIPGYHLYRSMLRNEVEIEHHLKHQIKKKTRPFLLCLHPTLKCTWQQWKISTLPWNRMIICTCVVIHELQRCHKGIFTSILFILQPPFTFALCFCF